MNLSTQHAWIMTGALAAVFAGGYLFYFGPQYDAAAQSREAAQAQARKIESDWTGSGAGTVPLKEVEGAITQRESQAFDDINQVFNVPLNYQRVKVGENGSTYFFNLLDHLKKLPAVKGLLKDAKLGWDRLDPDNKYPVEIKLRHLAMIDRVARAAGVCDLVELSEFTQTAAQEITPETERAAEAGGAEGGARGGRRPGLGGETPGAGAAGGAEGVNPAAEVRLVRVFMTVKFRGPESNLVKFLAQIQTPSPDATELTMVYLNHCQLLANEKTFGSLDGEMIISAIFPLKGDDLKAVLANAGQTVLK